VDSDPRDFVCPRTDAIRDQMKLVSPLREALGPPDRVEGAAVANREQAKRVPRHADRLYQRSSPAHRVGMTILPAALPTTTWNKRWGADLDRYRGRHVYKHYGDQWGDPSVRGLRYLWRKLRYGRRLPGNLAKVRRKYLEPYVTPETLALEIGSGGGRWTRYLLRGRKVVVVELNSEFFPYLQERFAEDAGKLECYETSGYEIGGIEDQSIDFVFSFGTFVHIDPDGIDAYLGEIKRVLRSGGTATIHYGDRSKKFFAGRPSDYAGFSDMDDRKMEGFLDRHGLEILAHDRKLLNHSNVAVFRRTI
jgi:SAM-dependent methyltransferase